MSGPLSQTADAWIPSELSMVVIIDFGGVIIKLFNCQGLHGYLDTYYAQVRRSEFA